MKRRDFLKYSMCGLAAVAVGSHLTIPPLFRRQAYAATQRFDVDISEVMVEMADATPVYHWRFQFTNPPLPDTFPGPVILARQGDSITLNVRNTLDEPHAFAVIAAGPNPNAFVPGSYSGVIAPFAGPVAVTFPAPAPGTYLYVDPLNGGTTAFGPGNRVLGLQGVLIVLPAAGNNPYGLTSGNVARLFNDLGSAPPISPPATPGLRTRPAPTTGSASGSSPRWTKPSTTGP